MHGVGNSLRAKHFVKWMMKMMMMSPLLPVFLHFLPSWLPDSFPLQRFNPPTFQRFTPLPLPHPSKGYTCPVAPSASCFEAFFSP
jgi:hypothetical protein